MAQDSDLTGELGLIVTDEPQGNENVSAVAIADAREKDQSNYSPLPESLLTESSNKNKSSLMTVDEARQQISAEVLSVLAEKFNGKLSEVRPVDPKDILF